MMDIFQLDFAFCASTAHVYIMTVPIYGTDIHTFDDIIFKSCTLCLLQLLPT